MNARRLTLTALASLCALTGGLQLWSASALAAEPPSPPTVEEESVANVASSSATLQAQVNPGGLETTYRFEYGPTSSYGTSMPVPDGDAGSATSATEVSAHPQDLKPDTTYHYRVIVSNTLQGEVTGPDQQFTTQAAGSEFALPDNREWELVSPPDKHGAGIYALGFVEGATIQAAQEGGAIAYATYGPTESNPQGNKAPEDTEVLSRRGPDGWETEDIDTPDNGGGLNVGFDDEYVLFSPDLSLGVVERSGLRALPPLPEGSGWTPYVRRNLSDEYEPLLTPADTLPGSYGEKRAEVVTGATPDLSHIVLTGRQGPLISGAVEGSLYEWAGGHLQVVSMLPASEGGATVKGRLAGSRAYEADTSPRHAISNDGSRIFWSTEGHIYLRDMDKEESVRISPGEGQFELASSAGSRVVFSEGGELYAFEVTSGSGEALAGKVVDLTSESSGMQHSIVGGSEDGSYVYFVAEDGADENLYVEHYDGTKWTAPRLIAALSPGDSPAWSASSFAAPLIFQPSGVSPNGRYLAFMSERSLTGYNNRDAHSGQLDEEVFLYDASSGHLVCASCNPTGARPVGTEGASPSQYPGQLVDASHIWASRWFAANIPGWTNTSNGTAHYQSRYLSDSGRLFFNSSDALVPADVDGTQDVYEYEPAGIGSCQSPGYGGSGSDVFSEAAGGCVALISSGISGEESAFLDASEEGGEVFFMTSSRLVPQDYDNAYDVYDAHECTSESPCPAPPPLTPPPCSTGDACKPAPTPQPAIFGAPSSETFSGAGNIVPSASPTAVLPSSRTRAQKLAQALKACGRKPRRKRAGCESQARRRYGSRKSKDGKSSSVRAGR